MNVAHVKADSLDALWDARDVARYLKASRSWVYQKAEAGLLPSLRIGGLLRFEPEVVRAWSRGASAGAAALPARADAP